MISDIFQRMRTSDQGFGKRRMALNKVTFLLLFGTLLFTFSVVERSTEPEESFISRLELRRATLLKHCSTKTKKSSQEQSMKQLYVVSFLNKPALKIFILSATFLEILSSAC